MIKSVVLKISGLLLGPVYGKKKFQSFFGFLHSISLKGMNLRYDPSGNHGETWVMHSVNQYYKPLGIVPVVFDVGANQGLYSIELGNTFSRLNLYSFEPSRSTFALLQKNVLPVAPSAALFNFGLSDKNETLELYCNSSDHTTNSLYPADHSQKHREGAVERIEVRRIDDFCRQHGLSHIHFLKIDVEGNEVNVLKGALPLIQAQAIDFIQFEFGPRNVDSRTFMRDFYHLLEPHFRIYRILRDGLHSQTPYHQDYEAFFAGNYLAVATRLQY